MQKNGDLANNASLKSVWQMLAHMNQEECGLGLKEIIDISETILLTWQDFANGPAVKAYKQVDKFSIVYLNIFRCL